MRAAPEHPERLHERSAPVLFIVHLATLELACHAGGRGSSPVAPVSSTARKRSCFVCRLGTPSRIPGSNWAAPGRTSSLGRAFRLARVRHVSTALTTSRGGGHTASNRDEVCRGFQSEPTTDQRIRGEDHGRYLYLRRLFEPGWLRLRQRRRLGRLLGQAGP